MTYAKRDKQARAHRARKKARNDFYRRLRPELESKQWKRLRQAVIARDGRCAKCGFVSPDRRYHVDHIKPVSEGGARLDMRNLQALCHRCHSVKTARARWRTDPDPTGTRARTRAWRKAVDDLQGWE